MESSEQKRLILDNQGLVHYFVKQFGVKPNCSEYDDLVSIGMIGLIKASRSFDEQKKIKFATYAATCINNEIRMNYRNTKKIKNEVSMEEPIAMDSEGGELFLENIIADKKVNIAKEIQNREEAEKTLRIMLNYLQGKERLGLLYRIGKNSQKKVGELIRVSQSYIARLERKAKNKVREAIQFGLHYDEVFSVEMNEYFWKVEFQCEDILLATNLQKIVPIAGLYGEVIYQNQRIIVKIPPDEIFLGFIAQIIQEVESYTTDN